MLRYAPKVQTVDISWSNGQYTVGAPPRRWSAEPGGPRESGPAGPGGPRDRHRQRRGQMPTTATALVNNKSVNEAHSNVK